MASNRILKILCVADERDPLVYSDRAKSRFGDVDLTLGAGDLSLDYYEFIVSSLNKPLYYVFGNHKLQDYAAVTSSRRARVMTRGSTHVGGRAVHLKEFDLIIAGLGGSKRYNEGANQYTEAQMCWRICKLVPRLLWNRLRHGRYLDILLTHAPPYREGDATDSCHEGFRVFSKFIQRFSPRYLIYGHVHLLEINAPRVRVVERTTLVNCYGYTVVTIER